MQTSRTDNPGDQNNPNAGGLSGQNDKASPPFKAPDNLPPTRPTTPPQSPFAILSGQRVEIAKDKPNPADTEATKILLDSCQKPDGWHCPKCQAIYTDPDAFARHLVDEINASVQQLTEAYKARTSKSTKV
jgi:hypothetical protein